ncbi:unnamed protein product [Rotaria sordida]|uniref:Uncharacterized protein n=2 Tax=Rotaria sordida TaxID=392033 RepID=A0A813XRF3_9BILA|nr:unnamed protein product [Rotaria sordida]CAF4099449.1 unnamed protein product [Rotaria sordida]
MSNQVLSSSTGSSITINMTSPIHRIIADTSLSSPLDYISSSEQININRNLSLDKSNSEPSTVLHERLSNSSSATSYSSKSSNNDSLRFFSPYSSVVIEENDDEDNVRMVQDSLSLFDDNSIVSILMSKCKICLEELSIESLSCCSSSICSKYLCLHLSIEFNRKETLSLLFTNDHDRNISERHKYVDVDINVIYICRNGDYPHMTYSKYQYDFCYNCKCKYNLYSDKPILRHIVHELIAATATLTISVAVVGEFALLFFSITIDTLTYDTYHLIKHIHSR